MNYTLNQLQVFLKVVHTQSVTKAAEALSLSQPAVSIQLKNFQDQFPIPLTEIIGRKIFITDFGKEIAKSAQKILDEVYAIRYKTLQYQGLLAGELKISAVSTGKYVMPYFLYSFMKQHEGVELLLDVTNKAKVIESLEKNQVDFSLVSVLPDLLDIQHIELLQNKLYLVANREVNLENKVYEKDIFEKIPLIYREKGSGTRHTMEKYMESSQIFVKKKMELTTNEAVKQAVLAGLGLSIMPLIGIKNELLSGELKIISVKGFPIQSMWNLIWLRNKSFSPIAKAYLQHIQTEKEAIVQRHFEWYAQIF